MSTDSADHINLFFQTSKHLPVWVPEDTAVSIIPPHMKTWLTDRNSLTKKLSQAYQSTLSINLLQQDWGEPDSTEVSALNIRDKGQKYIVRRVQLVLNGQARVYARSIFPESDSINNQNNIYQLGKTPLGNWLFTNPKLIRQPFEISAIKGKFIESDSGADPEKILWARRSIFQLEKRPPILVSEYFLTKLPEV